MTRCIVLAFCARMTSRRSFILLYVPECTGSGAWTLRRSRRVFFEVVGSQTESEAVNVRAASSPFTLGYTSRLSSNGSSMRREGLQSSHPHFAASVGFLRHLSLPLSSCLLQPHFHHPHSRKSHIRITKGRQDYSPSCLVDLDKRA